MVNENELLLSMNQSKVNTFEGFRIGKMNECESYGFFNIVVSYAKIVVLHSIFTGIFSKFYLDKCCKVKPILINLKNKAL